jgi:hypothetical protein
MFQAAGLSPKERFYITSEKSANSIAKATYQLGEKSLAQKLLILIKEPTLIFSERLSSEGKELWQRNFSSP